MSEQKYRELVVGDIRKKGDQCRPRGSSDEWFEPFPLGRFLFLADVSAYEYRRPITEPDNGFPAGMPELPPVPKGYDRWEYRGMGWESLDNHSYAVCGKGSKEWALCLSNGNPRGVCDIHYAEAVKLPTEPDYTSKEYQDAFRKAWAADPTIARKIFVISSQQWEEEGPKDIGMWDIQNFYRPHQQPKVKSQEELDKEACEEWVNQPVSRTFEDCWLAALAYARQPNNAA